MTNDIIGDLEKIMVGGGNYPYRNSINKIVNKLCSKKFGFTRNYFVDWCYDRYKAEKWIVKFDDDRGASWMTYLSMRVMYCLMSLRDIIIDDPKPRPSTLSGIDMIYEVPCDPVIMDLNHTHLDMPEREYRLYQIRETTYEILGYEVGRMVLEEESHKDIAAKLGKEYTSFNKTLNKRLDKLKEVLIERELA